MLKVYYADKMSLSTNLSCLSHDRVYSIRVGFQIVYSVAYDIKSGRLYSPTTVVFMGFLKFSKGFF